MEIYKMIPQIILQGRQSGKTTDLIKRCHEIGGYIVCRSQKECARIFQMARKMKLNISFPISYYEFIRKEYYGNGIKKFHIDCADEFLCSLTHVPIVTITMTKGDGPAMEIDTKTEGNQPGLNIETKPKERNNEV